MCRAVQNAGEEKQLALIRAHPDLAGRAARAKTLTPSSNQEQSGAGLDQLSDHEYQEFHRLNEAYKARFGFPFILAVKGHDKHSILASFARRLTHSRNAEREEALRQIERIAYFRLEAMGLS